MYAGSNTSFSNRIFLAWYYYMYNFKFGDQILTNGKYKSVIHRAVLNNKATRISLAIVNGPALEVVVAPTPKLVDNENQLLAYINMKYKDYFQLQQGSKLDDKSCLDLLRIPKYSLK